VTAEKEKIVPVDGLSLSLVEEHETSVFGQERGMGRDWGVATKMEGNHRAEAGLDGVSRQSMRHLQCLFSGGGGGGGRVASGSGVFLFEETVTRRFGRWDH
jgi:hypothetical protein